MKRFADRILSRIITIEKLTLVRISFILTGIASTVWFLIRVIPKPSRATYPCMRAAAPIMSGFVIYILFPDWFNCHSAAGKNLFQKLQIP